MITNRHALISANMYVHGLAELRQTIRDCSTSAVIETINVSRSSIGSSDLNSLNWVMWWMPGPGYQRENRETESWNLSSHCVRSNCLSGSAASPRQPGAQLQTECCYSNRTSAEAFLPLASCEAAATKFVQLNDADLNWIFQVRGRLNWNTSMRIFRRLYHRLSRGTQGSSIRSC